jgi:hypothetical protein
VFNNKNNILGGISSLMELLEPKQINIFVKNMERKNEAIMKTVTNQEKKIIIPNISAADNKCICTKILDLSFLSLFVLHLCSL